MRTSLLSPARLCSSHTTTKQPAQIAATFDGAGRLWTGWAQLPRCIHPLSNARTLPRWRPSAASQASSGEACTVTRLDKTSDSRAATLKGVAQFLGIAAASVMAAYYLHPALLNMVAEMYDFNNSDDSNFENSFFGLVGIIYGLMGGNTFLFLYERQVNIVQELYGETFAVELLLQQTFLAVPDPAPRNAMSAFVRRYIEEELYDPIEMTSPFHPQSSFAQLVNVVVQEQEAGCEVGGVVEAVQKLADAQSRRSAVAAQVLPGMHWVFLNSLLFIFVICFLVFDAANDTAQAVNEERRLAFGALVGVLTLTQQVLIDLNDPIKGLYTFRPSLESRLSYVYQLLDQLEQAEPGWVPPELRQLQKLGLVGSLTGSETSPSVPHPARKGRKGRASEQSYVGGPLHFMNAAAHGQQLEDRLEAEHQQFERSKVNGKANSKATVSVRATARSSGRAASNGKGSPSP